MTRQPCFFSEATQPLRVIDACGPTILMATSGPIARPWHARPLQPPPPQAVQHGVGADAVAGLEGPSCSRDSPRQVLER